MAVYTAAQQGRTRRDRGGLRPRDGHGAVAAPAGLGEHNYCLETPRGRHLLRIDEVKGELDVKRELDLLVYLRKHGFPCPQPLADRRALVPRESRQVRLAVPLARRPASCVPTA